MRNFEIYQFPFRVAGPEDFSPRIWVGWELGFARIGISRRACRLKGFVVSRGNERVRDVGGPSWNGY